MTDTPAVRTSTGAVVATVLTSLLLLIACGLASVLGLMLVFTTDSCGVNDCNTGLIVLGMGITGLVPWAVAVATGVWGFLRGRSGGSYWWVPLVGLVVVTAVAVAGIAIALSGGSTSP